MIEKAVQASGTEEWTQQHCQHHSRVLVLLLQGLSSLSGLLRLISRSVSEGSHSWCGVLRFRVLVLRCYTSLPSPSSGREGRIAASMESFTAVLHLVSAVLFVQASQESRSHREDLGSVIVSYRQSLSVRQQRRFSSALPIQSPNNPLLRELVKHQRRSSEDQ
jgi:hypothetical protein